MSNIRILKIKFHHLFLEMKNSFLFLLVYSSDNFSFQSIWETRGELFYHETYQDNGRKQLLLNVKKNMSHCLDHF